MFVLPHSEESTFPKGSWKVFLFLSQNWPNGLVNHSTSKIWSLRATIEVTRSVHFPPVVSPIMEAGDAFVRHISRGACQSSYYGHSFLSQSHRKKALKAREARVNPLQGTGSVFMIKNASQDQELNYDEVPFALPMVVHILRKAHGKSHCLATRGTAFALRKRPFS